MGKDTSPFTFFQMDPYKKWTLTPGLSNMLRQSFFFLKRNDERQEEGGGQETSGEYSHFDILEFPIPQTFSSL